MLQRVGQYYSGRRGSGFVLLATRQYYPNIISTVFCTVAVICAQVVTENCPLPVPLNREKPPSGRVAGLANKKLSGGTTVYLSQRRKTCVWHLISEHGRRFLSIRTATKLHLHSKKMECETKVGRGHCKEPERPESETSFQIPHNPQEEENPSIGTFQVATATLRGSNRIRSEPQRSMAEQRQPGIFFRAIHAIHGTDLEYAASRAQTC